MNSINPIKILVLFLSMTILSVFLDEVGFFRYLAGATLKKSGSSQKKLFALLYLIVSVLTVFTSNDIIVLTFTPFICYFAVAAKIKPLPYLITVFVAANTWSLALIIGNPTNIFLATSGGVDFIAYIKMMILPTIAAGLTSFVVLYLLFKKDFAEKISIHDKPLGKSGYISDVALLAIGLLHLIFATVMLAVSSYIGLEMWIVALGSVVSLFVFNLVLAAIKRRRPKELLSCLRRAPWSLVPFLLIMFGLVLLLKKWGVPLFINQVLAKISGGSSPATTSTGSVTAGTIFTYGISSFLCCNIINNIPMSVLFSSVVEPLSENLKNPALFATIIGSNLGAFLTPIGALAGVMWRKILGQQGIDFKVRDFIKYGGAVGVPGLLMSLLVLAIVLIP